VKAFADHFILPATVILQRRAEATLDLRDPAALVGLAMKCGLSTHSLIWRLKNVLNLTEAERRIAQLLAEPFRWEGGSYGRREGKCGARTEHLTERQLST
jgi:hypothetical protein